MIHGKIMFLLVFGKNLFRNMTISPRILLTSLAPSLKERCSIFFMGIRDSIVFVLFRESLINGIELCQMESSPFSEHKRSTLTKSYPNFPFPRCLFSSKHAKPVLYKGSESSLEIISRTKSRNDG